MIKLMDTGNSPTKMETNIKVIGLMTNNMAPEYKASMMDLNLKVNSYKERNMDWVNSHRLMGHFMMANLLKTTIKVKGNINGLKEHNMKELGRIIKWKAKEHLAGQMDVNMWVNSITIRKKGQVF